jgi:hypothetical protein
MDVVEVNGNVIG